jgi:hypothetical protein
MKTLNLISAKGTTLFTLRTSEKSTFLNPSKELVASVGKIENLTPATLLAVLGKIATVEVATIEETASVNIDDL